METKNADDVSIVYLNIGSLPKHIDELRNFLSATNCYPTIIVLSETKITEIENIDYNPSLENYTYKNIKSSTRSGSVGFFAKNDIIFREDLNI